MSKLLQVSWVREGMSRIFPLPIVTLMTAKRLEELVCGMPEVDFTVLRSCMRYLIFFFEFLFKLEVINVK